jgi:hypothetical protein
MDIDDLKTAWRALDDRIESASALNAHVLRQLTLNRAQSALRPVAWRLWGEIALAVAAAILLGAFLGDHWRTASFAIPAVLLHAAAIASIASGAAQLQRLKAIDYAQPVVGIQGALAELAVKRARQTRWHLLLAFLLWTPFAIVALKGLFGFDVYRWFGTGWVAANAGFSVAITPLMIWLVRRFDDRIRREGILASLADDLTGRRLAVANGLLAEVGAFEKGT